MSVAVDVTMHIVDKQEKRLLLLPKNDTENVRQYSQDLARLDQLRRTGAL